ncbi:hypothetical protein AB6G71_17370 [Mammaliicoccus sciuri]|uniref:hypothetical protein n=1 Tax=Mammaliicoccus sciuri TaxID=1296 RepID=UPI0034DD99A9
MSIARYSPEKQLDHQINLISKLQKDFNNIELHLYGYGGEYNKLKNKFLRTRPRKQYKIGEKITGFNS